MGRGVTRMRVFGIALGSEGFVRQIRGRLGGADDGQQSNCPSLRELRRLEKATPEEVEEAVEAVFAAQREAAGR